jgi:hypothetical protein
VDGYSADKIVGARKTMIRKNFVICLFFTPVIMKRQRNQYKSHVTVVQVSSGITCQVVINQAGNIVDARYRIQDCSYTVADNGNSLNNGPSTSNPSPSGFGQNSGENTGSTNVEI